MLNAKGNTVRTLIAFAVSAVLLFAAGWILFNKQHILDTMAVWNYTPSETVSSIADRAKFTEKGKFIFYATNPTIATGDDFNKNCPRQEVNSPILGCYTRNNRIYIYDIQHEQLDGMEEVTAVHEMLHAVWARMSEGEKEKLTVELQKAYKKQAVGELKRRIEYYQRTEPSELNNELHSILGTEFADLGEPLESYYAKFYDRAAVLTLHQKYRAVHQTLYGRANELYSKMEQLAASITSRSEAYRTAVAKYSADVDSFNARAERNDFASQAQFNTERAALIQRSNQLNAERVAINTDIDTYTGYQAEYQKIAEQIDILNRSVDSFQQIDESPLP